ncbi:MAG: septum formation inhibitor Maf [Gemmatimonadales bacterium]|nr:MAG: septum formation inhibitor Maf [Gemmatimonadales bacterium]
MTERPRGGGRPHLILASASPRRSEILRGLGLSHQIRPAHVDETPLADESPSSLTERLARAKAMAVLAHTEGVPVVGGDTVVALDGEILGKPVDADQAVAMLLQLSGRDHHVYSGLALAMVSPEEDVRVVSGVQATRVRFRPFDAEVAAAYVATGEPMDKAGAYGIQGLGAVLVEEIQGDHSGVVGLPISLLVRLLGEVGMPYRFPASVPGG